MAQYVNEPASPLRHVDETQARAKVEQPRNCQIGRLEADLPQNEAVSITTPAGTLRVWPQNALVSHGVRCEQRPWPRLYVHNRGSARQPSELPGAVGETPPRTTGEPTLPGVLTVAVASAHAPGRAGQTVRSGSADSVLSLISVVVIALAHRHYA